MKDIERIEIKAWKDKYPLLNKLISTEEVFWINPNLEKFQTGIKKSPLTLEDVKDAEERLQRFAPFISKAFPETKESSGIIESPLVRIPSMKKSLEQNYQQPIPGELLLKCDSHLPISGSIKAEAGFMKFSSMQKN